MNLKEETVTLAHGAGGKQTAALIERVFRKHFSNPYFTADDAAVLPAPSGRIAVTTDSFIVSPQFFNGGNIGKLSVCGTVNDLACMGARPLYMTCAFVIEEGYPMDRLDEIASSMEKAAGEAGVSIVAGDTKVAGRGQADGVFINTTGIGQVMEGVSLSGSHAESGDKVIVTGRIGRHGCCILLERGGFGIEADVASDCAPLWGAVQAVLTQVPQAHVIRDATRGGVGTVLYEIAKESGVGFMLDADAVPVDDQVLGVTGLLGLDPLYLACEGTMVMTVPPESADQVLDILHRQPYTEKAAVIGSVISGEKGRVVMRTGIGTQTYLPEPGNELLPRIC